MWAQYEIISEGIEAQHEKRSRRANGMPSSKRLRFLRYVAYSSYQEVTEQSRQIR